MTARKTLKRVGLVVASLVVLMVVAAVVVNRRQRQVLAHSLIADFASLDSWSAPGTGMRVDNGFACFVERTSELSDEELVRLNALASQHDDDALADAGTLMRWAIDTRRCVEARKFAPVERLRSYPSETNDDVDRYQGQFYRLTVFDIEQRLDAGAVDEAAEACVELGEHLVAQSHLSLISNMLGWFGARVMSTPCARAFGEMSETTAARLNQRIERLPGALAPNHEWLRHERVFIELAGYGEALTADELRRIPRTAFPPVELGIARLTAPAAWVRSRRRFDALLALADTPGDARREASAALDEADTSWLLGRGDSWHSMNYEKFLARRDDVQRVLVLLADPERASKTGASSGH